MRRSTRHLSGTIAALLLATAVWGSGSATAVVAAKPKGKIDRPCTLLDAATVKKAFGGPVADPVEDDVFASCTFAVGDDPTQAPGGLVSVVQLFPSFSQALPTAKTAFQDQHAIDVLSNFELSDVNGLGLGAYMNLTTGTLVVLASKKFELSVSWQPGSITTTVTKQDQQKLVQLAKQAVKRAPR